jgi:anti-repressor protein
MSNLVTVSNAPSISFFEYGSRQVRTTVVQGLTAFCLADVLVAMKTKVSTYQAQAAILEGLGEGCTISLPLSTPGGEQDTVFVYESGLTFLLSRSRTESGRGLNRLIHTEILPSIRKTGKYETVSVAPATPKVPTTFREAMLLAIDLDDARAALQAKIDGDADRVGFAKAIEKADDNILVGTLAKSLGNVGPNILMGLLRGNKILQTSTSSAKHNIPYQRYIDSGYFVVDESTIEINNKTRLTLLPKSRPRGQIWLTNKYYEWQKVAA